MTAPDKTSAIAAMASDLGTSMAHTPAAPENSAIGDLFMALDDEVSGHDASTIQPVRRGRGRPPGSVSRTTKQLQAFLQARGYRDPAEFLAAIVSMDTKALRKALGSTDKDGNFVMVDAVDVLKVQVRAAENLMPYFHQRLPQQVEHVGEGARPLIMIVDSAPGATKIVGDAGTMSVHDIVINQQLRDGGEDE